MIMVKEEKFIDVLRKSQDVVRDSASSEKVAGWTKYNSSLDSFDASFRKFYPESFEGLGEYIEHTLIEKEGQVRGVELGGPGSRLFAGFYDGFIKRSLGVILEEDERQNIGRKENHDILLGDMFDNRTFQKIKEWLKKDKVDLLFERMVKPIMDQPDDPRFLWSVLARYYPLLGENSLLFAELPDVTTRENLSTMQNWTQETKQNSRLNLEAKLAEQDGNMYFHLHKQPGAPAELPRF
jgi:hypothetical protein